MKRELAALETKSPMLDSIGRTTRSSKRISGVSPSGISKSLVYKRVKKSVQVEKAASNGVLEVSKTSEVVGHQNVIHDAQMESENATALVVEEIETGKEAGVSGEVLQEVGDEPASMDVREKDINGSFFNGENALFPRNGIVQKVTVDDGLLKNVLSDDDAKVKSGLEEEQAKKVDSMELSLTDDGNAAVVNALNANGGAMELDEVKILGEKSPLKVNGNAKISSVDNFSRRFTRSALKSKVDINRGENFDDEQSQENPKEVTNDPNGEICREIVLFESQSSKRNGEMKNLSPEKSTRRLTRSASKPKGEGSSSGSMEPVAVDSEKAVVVSSSEGAECGVDKHKEPKSATPWRKLEMKMSKQISHTKIPTNVLELFETGLLEGCPVYYDGGKGKHLNGRIRGVGILCSCGLCRGCKVIPPSLFEIHACNKYKRAAQYIRLENGRSLINILKTCKTTRLNTLEATVQNAIGPLPEKKIIVCQNCKEQFSSMDAECSEPVCSTCVMSNVSPVGPVYSYRKRCRSSKFFNSSQAASACDMLQVSGRKKSVEESTNSFTPKLHTSEADIPSDSFQETSHLKSLGKSADVSLIPRLRSSSRVEKKSETKASEEIVKSFQEQKSCSSPMMQKPLEAKRRKKLKNRSFKASLSPKLSKSIRSRKFSPKSNHEKAAKRLSLTPKPLKTPSTVKSSEKKTSGKITRKDLRLHKLVFEDDVLPDGTELGYYARGQKLLDGFKKGFGIFCNCCDTVVSASQFEAHAGCATRRKPYCYIYTSNGVSLHELSVNLIKDRRHSSKYNDDLCTICADGGNLLLCDGCPRAFHTECASLPSIPLGKWYCKYCENMFEREKFVAHNANALAAGRVSGVDSIEQITKRSIRIVNNVASEVSACILCRGYDFCKSGFGPRTIILCDQCEKEYHVGCLKDHNMAHLTELPDGKWFCSADCGRIESSLEKLLVRGVEKLPESLVDVIQKKDMQNVSDNGTDLDVSWRLLSGRIASPETRPLLSQAVAIFHESFAPIIDVVSGHDLIPAMVYGRNVGGQEYGGMYCAVLTVNSVVVSAGIFRIFGPEVAELPLVATSSGNHGKGYFQTLFACIEKLLAFLKVKTLVLPAAEEAGSIWTDRFGFKRMTLDQVRELKRNFWSLVRFQGTSMLHKVVPGSGVIEGSAE